MLAVPFRLGTSQPVKTDVKKELNADTLTISFNLSIANGWHVYSTNLEGKGPTQAEMVIDSISGAVAIDGLQFEGQEQEKFDNLFDMQVRYFSNNVRFVQRYLVEENYYLEGALQYGACDDESCLPPQKCEFLYTEGGVADLSVSENDKKDSSSLLDSPFSSDAVSSVNVSVFCSGIFSIAFSASSPAVSAVCSGLICSGCLMSGVTLVGSVACFGQHVLYKSSIVMYLAPLMCLLY